MLVKDFMTRHPIMIAPETQATEAQRIMTENRVRHLPVVGSGKRLLGLITHQCFAFRTDQLASLNVWEITRYLSDMTVDQIMIKAGSVYTTTPDRTMERAAEMMAQHKISCLPVLEDGIVVGIISEVDLLRAFQAVLGMLSEGIRVTMRMPDQKGEFTKLTMALAEHGWGVMGVGSFPTPRRAGYYDVVLKIPAVQLEEVREVLGALPGQEVVDIRAVA